MFFTWNPDYNNNRNFRQISITQARNFFLWVKDNNYTYTRAKIIRTVLAGLGDFGEFGEFVLGEPNRVSFPKEKLKTLRMYLSMKHDYIGLVILDYVDLGVDILTLRIGSEDFNPTKKYSE